MAVPSQIISLQHNETSELAGINFNWDIYMYSGITDDHSKHHAVVG
jgi:hypothetical protein